MVTLDSIPVGLTVRVKGFHQTTAAFRHKLLAMGCTPGVALKVLCVAPLGDPVQLLLRGYTLSLRKKECQQIEVEYIDGNTHQSSRSLQTHDCPIG